MLLAHKKCEKADMEQVYRFKVALKLRKRLWRRIEVKGAQTLGELDRIIRDRGDVAKTPAGV